ncbi:MAG: hypothetical protein OXU20_09910, partial [Myxococcales bacterium]|nr:hypothetical protein [Myxococcales bacterium]
ACNGYAIRYATEAKQYMLDTSIALLIYAVSLRAERPTERGDVRRFALLGAVCIWFSNIAVVFLAVAGTYVAVSKFRSERALRWAWAPVAWLCSLGVYYALFIYGHPTRDYMLKYWHAAFLPWPPWSPEAAAFVAQKLTSLVRDMLAGGLSLPASLILLLGLGQALVVRNHRLVMFAVGPLALHLALSALHLYPFAHRLALYFVPVSAWVLGFMVGEAARILKEPRWLPVVASLPLWAVFVISCARFPFEHEELRENLAYVRAHSSPGQTIYVHPGAWAAFDYYQHVGPSLRIAPVRGDPGAWVGSEGFPGIERSRLTGDVWLLFSHLRGRDRAWLEFDPKGGVDGLGGELLRSHRTRGSSTCLLRMEPCRPPTCGRNVDGVVP